MQQNSQGDPGGHEPDAPADRLSVQPRAGESRYVLIDQEAAGGPSVIGQEAYVDLDDAGSRQRVFFHTEVSEEYAGQGLASVLVREAVEHTIADGFSVVPVCPYVAKWLLKHPEYAEHVVEPSRLHLRAIRAREQ